MRLVIHFFLVLSLLCNLQSASGQQPDITYDDDTEAYIKAVENNLGTWLRLENTPSTWNIHDRMNWYKVHGVSIAVIKDYSIHWARGYGWADTSDKRPVKTNTLFQAASISKSLNAMGVLKLADRKQLDLYENINRYLKSWKFPEDSFTRNQKINTANLLSHTAGLSVHGFPGYEWKDSLPSDNEILDGIRPANTPAVRSEFAPGQRFQYSGGGTTISKKIIMDMTGQAYDMYMWKEVMEPIGMKNSLYTQPPPPGAFRFLSTAYYRDGSPVKGKFHIYPEQAADGLWTTPTDLARYIIEMQLSRQGRSNKVLSQQMTNTMLTPYIDAAAALGVFINKHGGLPYFEHNGANEGFRCIYIGSMEQGNGLVVMVNSDDGRILDEIVNSIATVYKWKDFYQPVVKKNITPPKALLDDYTGTYMLNNNLIEVKLVEGKPVLNDNGNLQAAMYFTSEKDFLIFEVQAELSFLKNAAGKTEAMLIKQNGGALKAIKKQ